MGSFVGLLQAHDGTAVTLAPARAVRWEPRETHVMDVAADGLPKRLSSVSAQIAGPVHIADVTLIAPLSKAACQSIVRVSEDNLSLVTPSTVRINGQDHAVVPAPEAVAESVGAPVVTPAEDRR